MKSKSYFALFGILAILLIVFLGFEYYRIGDFQIYLEAAQDIFSDKNIYTELYGTPKVFPYMGSPTLALLIYPLTKSTLIFASLFWKLINLFLLFRIWMLLESFFGKVKFSENKQLLFLVLSILSTSFFIYRNFHLVQLTIFLLYSILEGVHQIRKGKHPLLGSFILSVGVLTKLLPIVIIPYLIFRGYWRNVLSIFGMLCILLLLPSLFLGWDKNLLLHQSWLLSINPMDKNNFFDLSTRSIHGIAALISSLSIHDLGYDHTLNIRRNIFDLDHDLVRLLIISVKILFVIGTLYFLRVKKIFTDHTSKLDQCWELSYILTITPLIFPQQRSYAFFFILPCISYLLYGFLLNPKLRKPGIILLFIVGILILNLDLIFGQYRKYYWHCLVLK